MFVKVRVLQALKRYREPVADPEGEPIPKGARNYYSAKCSWKLHENEGN